MFLEVVKQDGRREVFDPEKIAQSIFKAAQKVGGKDNKLSSELGKKVLMLLYQKALAQR